MTLIAEIFPKLQSPKKMVTSMSRKSRFMGSFEKQHGKRAPILLKFAWQHLYHMHGSLSLQLTCKKSLLVMCKISRMFPNTLSGDGNFSLLSRDNLTQPNEMKVSRKQKPFSQFFQAFLKYTLNFEHFEKRKTTLIAEVLPKIRSPKDKVRSKSKKSRSKGSSGKEHGKRAQILLKFAWQNLYHNY